MIRVTCVGHIKTSIGAAEVELDGDDMEPSEIVEKLRAMVVTGTAGFDKFNTLAMIEDGEAFVPASSKRKVKDGERIVLIPFSHGG